jgi:CheY-like chemotaxis protein
MEVPDMETVLLIEDKTNQQILYRMELEDEGYRVLSAANLPEALFAVRTQHPDIAVLDFGLRPEGGAAALQAIRGANPNLPIVLYTGLWPVGDGVRMHGPLCIVIKSSNTGLLVKAVKRMTQPPTRTVRLWWVGAMSGFKLDYCLN